MVLRLMAFREHLEHFVLFNAVRATKNLITAKAKAAFSVDHRATYEARFLLSHLIVV
jgi:hypothetical protein